MLTEKMGEGAHEPRSRRPLQGEEGKEADTHLENPERNSPGEIFLDFSPVRPVLDFFSFIF